MGSLSRRLRRLPDEFQAQQWARRPKRLAGVRITCGCGKFGKPGGEISGFRCRDRGRFKCGRYCCACVGGDDNRCARCANALDRSLTEAGKLRAKAGP